MRKDITFCLVLFILSLTQNAYAQLFSFWRYQSTTDCTALTNGKSRDLCYDTDDQTLYKCVPSAGDCDTAGEWMAIQIGEIASILYETELDTYSELDAQIADETIVNTDDSQTLTNKTLTFGGNTITMTEAQLESAVTDDNPLFDGDIGTNVQAYDVDTAKTDVNEVITGDYDFGGGGIEIENNTTVPGSCIIGQLFLDTDATSGEQLYACEGGTFVLQGGSGSGTPGGSSTQVQFNNGGSFAGDSGLTYSSSTDVLTVAGSVTVPELTTTGTLTFTSTTGFDFDPDNDGTDECYMLGDTMTCTGGFESLGFGVTVSGTVTGFDSNRSFIRFGESHDGSIRIGSNDNNNSIDFDMQTGHNKVKINSIDTVNRLDYDQAIQANRILVGGVENLAGTDLSSKVVAYFPLDEQSGTTVTDLSGTYTGTISEPNIQDYMTTTGKIAQALKFIDTDNHEVTFTDSALKVGSGDFAICAWLRHGRANAPTSQRIAGNRNNSDGTGYELVLVAQTLTRGGTFRFNFDIGASNFSIDSTSEFDDGDWHHVCAMRSGSTLSLYFDGVSEGTPTGSSSGDFSTNAGNTILGGTPLSPAQFDGEIDEYIIFNDDLTSDEVAALYNSGSGIYGYASESSNKPNILSTTLHETSTSTLNDANDLLIGDALEVTGSIIMSSQTGSYGSGSAYACINDAGEIFASDVACP